MIWDGFPEIRRELDRVQAVIRAEVTRPGGVIAEGLSELANRDAKLLRPAFTILAARIQTGGRAAEERIIRLAAAIELLHIASLIHDDIVDGAEHRRGGKALHRKYGDRTAVLMGDFLFARCFSLVSDYARPENASLLTGTVGHLIESEVSEYTADNESEWSVRKYLHRVIGKTAVLFSLSFHIGAAEACDENCDQRSVEVLRRIGYNIGIGFQIIDDVLDIFGEQRTTGKTGAVDLKQGILTLPVILAANNGQRARLIRTLEKIARRHSRKGGINRFWENRALDEVRTRIEEAGGRQGAIAAAEVYTRRAHRELDRLPDSADRATLRSVTAQLLSRAS
ncbi:MAG: polyprenyl synthetase family protein [Spirochaeta sp.]|jgi:heptaprenyl diphosphate synthase|nr:polyprenyl synthetase family protein [Spirochaeta sp.]